MKQQNKLSLTFFAIVFIAILYLVWLMAKQMIEPIIFGLILSGVFYPLNSYIQAKFKLKTNQAASLTSFIIVAIVFVPVIFIAISMSEQAVGLYERIVNGLSRSEVNDFLFGDGIVASLVKKIASSLNLEVNFDVIKSKLLNLTESLSSHLLSKVNQIVGNIVSFIFNLFIMIIVMFGVFVEGEKLKKYIFELSPLPDHQEETFLKKFNQMNYVTLVCNGVGGIIQGLLGGIGLWLAGIDSLILWTIVMIVLAFIPLVGISVVTIPASIYLILTGSNTTGIVLLLYTGAVGLVVENWFKPRFIGDRIQINSTFVLLTIIGGMGAFGIGGIFYGPIIGILFLTIVEMYHEQYSKT